MANTSLTAAKIEKTNAQKEVAFLKKENKKLSDKLTEKLEECESLALNSNSEAHLNSNLYKPKQFNDDDENEEFDELKSSSEELLICYPNSFELIQEGSNEEEDLSDSHRFV